MPEENDRTGSATTNVNSNRWQSKQANGDDANNLQPPEAPGHVPIEHRHARHLRPQGTLFNAPDFGILSKMADDGRRRSCIWEIPDKK